MAANDGDSVYSDDTEVLAIPARADLNTVLDDIVGAFSVPKPRPPGSSVTHGTVDKVKQRAPAYTFGGSGINRFEGGVTNPSPGIADAPHAYDQHNRVGEAQASSMLATAPRPVFGCGDRFREQEKLYTGQDTAGTETASPGPAMYPIPALVGNELPTFSFPRSKRGTQQPVSPEKARVPGPGSYYTAHVDARASAKAGVPASTSSLGRQVASTIRSSPVAQVGTGTREAFAKRYTGAGNEPLPSDKNPGFTYNNQRSGMGKQEISVRRTLPAFSFGAKSPRKLPRNYHAVQAERRELAQRRLLEVTRKWELDISSSKRRPATSSGNDYSWLHKTDKSLREERIRATGGSKGAYNQRTDGCELGKGKSYLNSPRFSFGSSSRFSEKQFMAHRPESTNTRTPGPGPKYQLPSRLGETPGHTFPKTKREPVRPPRIVTPGPGAYNLSADARLEEHSVAAMLRTMESGRAVTPKARNFYVKEARPGQTHASTPPPRQTTRTPGTMPRDGGSPGSPLRMHSPVRTPGMPLHMTHESVRKPFAKYSAAGLGMSPARFGVAPGSSTSPRAVFGTSVRNAASKVFAGSSELNSDRLGLDSPGPTYQTRPQSGVTMPRYSFGGQNVSVVDAKLPRGEGGRMTNMSNDFFKQASGALRSPPVAHFGSSKREKASKVFMPGLMEPGRESPGPSYGRVDSVGKQVQTHKPTSPRPIIGTSPRLLNEVSREAMNVPGPGTYGTHERFQRLPRRNKDKQSRRRARARRKLQQQQTVGDAAQAVGV